MSYLVQAGDHPHYESLSDLLSDGWPQTTLVLEVDTDGHGVELESLLWFMNRDDVPAERETAEFWRHKYESAAALAVAAAQRVIHVRESIGAEQDANTQAIESYRRKLAAAENKAAVAERKLAKAEADLAREREYLRVSRAASEKLRQELKDARVTFMKEVAEKLGDPGGHPVPEWLSQP